MLATPMILIQKQLIHELSLCDSTLHAFQAKNKHADISCYDLSKAFDYISHYIFPCQLESYSVHSSGVEFIESSDR